MEPYDVGTFSAFQWGLFRMWSLMGKPVHVWNSIGCWCGPKYVRLGGSRWGLIHRKRDSSGIGV